MSAEAPQRDPAPSKNGLRHYLRVFWEADGWVGWVRSFCIALCLAGLIRWPITEPYSIPSGSMEPTLHGDPRFLRGDRVFVNKWIYGVRYPFMNKRIWHGEDPKRWDVVVFKSVEKNAKHETLVKRIVGLPGERIEIRGGKVYANGKALKLPKSMPDIYYTDYGSYGVLPQKKYSLIPPGHYLVLGDNSAYSRDGRVFGWLPNQNIVGRVACIWWPIGHARDFTGFTHTLWWRGSLLMIAVFLIWRMFVGRSWRVQGTELGERFSPKAHLYINRLAFGLPVPLTRIRLTRGRAPRRGEIVSYYAKMNNDLVVLAGRVAALPGEQLALKDDRVAVNGALLEAPPSLVEHVFPAVEDGEEAASEKGDGYTYPPENVPDNAYFILVDNAESLPDSRMLGPVPQKNLIGSATRVWWPPSKWGKIDV